MQRLRLGVPFPWLVLYHFAPLEQDNRDTSALLIALHRDIRNDFAGSLRNIPRMESVQRVHKHVVATLVATTKALYLRPEDLELSSDGVFDNVLYPKTASSRLWANGDPVNVEPVVPVRRT